MLVNKDILRLKVFLWIILAIVVVWLLYMAIAPSGQVSYVYDFESPNYFIQKLTPSERVKPPQNGSQEIIGNPVYFALHTARRFDKAKLTLKYKNNSNLPLIEAGVLADKIIWRYDLKPIENRLIDDLSAKWNAISEDRLILLQREKKYQSIDEFLDNMPRRQEVALYNYKLKEDFILSDYQPGKSENKINYALRGPWQIYTYIKNEDLEFTFDFADLNRNKDADVIDLNLYFRGSLIESKHLDDDGIVVDSGQSSERGEIKLTLAGLPEGVYKVELKVNDDIITEEIVTKQWKLSFINKIWLADDGQKNIALFSDSAAISAQTINPGRLQTLKVGERDLKITETYRQFSIKASSTASEIKLEKDDIILAGNGVFSFNKDSLINPKFKKVDENFDADREGINYILADYTPSPEEDGWKIGRVELNLNGTYREDEQGLFNVGAGKYNFIISIPGLKVEDDIEDSVEIKEIRVDLEGTSLWEKLKKIIYNSPPF